MVFAGFLPVPRDCGMLLEDARDLYDWACRTGRTLPFEAWVKPEQGEGGDPGASVACVL